MEPEQEPSSFDSIRRSEEQPGFHGDEASYVCNACGESIVVPLDPSGGQRQEYVEDCPVCCNPNVIQVEFDSDGQPHLCSRSEQDLN